MKKIIILILIEIFMTIGLFPIHFHYDNPEFQGLTPTPTYSLLVENPTPMPTPAPWGRPRCDPYFLPYPYEQQDCWFRVAPPRR